MRRASEPGVRRPRRQRPGTRWFVTVRCARAQFRLLPDEPRKRALVYFLGAALQRFPQVQLHAAIAMSNHIHLVLTDGAGELADFMCILLGPLAKAINAMDGVRGHFFERRYAATEIIDDEALLERILYTVTNPAAANLVSAVEDWGGLCLWQGGVMNVAGSRFRKKAYDRAVRAQRRLGAQPRVDLEAYTDRVRIEISPIELRDRDATAELRAMVATRLRTLHEKRRGVPVLGMAKVRAQGVFASPERPKRSPMPLCHASTPELWKAFRHGWRKFEHAYRAASERFRAGLLSVSFPEHAFRPPAPILP